MLQCYQTREKSGSGSSQSDERTMMDEDWWLGSTPIPEEGLTSVITISPSNPQSHLSMAPKWQKRLCNSSASRGKLRPFQGKECASARFFGYLLWSGERVKALLFFWMVPGRVFLWLLCVDTMKCVLETKASKPLSALRSCPPSSSHWWLLQTRLQKKSVFYVRFLWFENSSDTFWNGSFWVLKWFKPLKSESHLWFRLWRLWNHSLSVHNHLFFHVLWSERTSDLHNYQLFFNFKSTPLTDRTKYIL